MMSTSVIYNMFCNTLTEALNMCKLVYKRTSITKVKTISTWMNTKFLGYLKYNNGKTG